MFCQHTIKVILQQLLFLERLLLFQESLPAVENSVKVYYSVLIYTKISEGSEIHVMFSL